jgi:hypothetical protein
MNSTNIMNFYPFKKHDRHEEMQELSMKILQPLHKKYPIAMENNENFNFILGTLFHALLAHLSFNGNEKITLEIAHGLAILLNTTLMEHFEEKEQKRKNER